MNTQRLQTSIARLFPDDYSADNWKELLPRFIARQIEIYDEETRSYLQTIPDCAPDDPRMSPPAYPMMPEVFADACEVQATTEGLDFRALACCLFLDKDKIERYKQGNEQLTDMCQQSNEVNKVLLADNRRLIDGIAIGKWLN